MTLIFDFDFLAFFGLGECRLCHLVSGSYSNTHGSLPVMTFCSKFGLVSRCFRMSSQTSMHYVFWSMVNSFGTTFAQIFFMPKSSVIIFQTQSQLMFSSSTIIRIVSQQSLHIICLTHSHIQHLRQFYWLTVSHFLHRL